MGTQWSAAASSTDNASYKAARRRSDQTASGLILSAASDCIGHSGSERTAEHIDDVFICSADRVWICVKRIPQSGKMCFLLMLHTEHGGTVQTGNRKAIQSKRSQPQQQHKPGNSDDSLADQCALPLSVIHPGADRFPRCIWVDAWFPDRSYRCTPLPRRWQGAASRRSPRRIPQGKSSPEW